MNKIIPWTQLYLKRPVHMAMVCISAVGVVLTTVTAVTATPKAVRLIEVNSRKNHDGDPHASTKLEAVQSCWSCYVPTAIIGLSTIACIFGTAALSKHHQASLVSAYGLLNETYRKYRKAAKDVYGNDADSQIVAEIAQKVYAYESVSGALNFDPDSSSDEILFYDSYSGRYFMSTMAAVVNAQYHLNRNFALRGEACINELYEFMGIEKTIVGEVVGWNCCDLSESSIQWIDFDNTLVEMDDGLECYIVTALYDPTPLGCEG